MTLSLLIAVTVSAAPAAPVKLAAPGFTAVQMPEDVGRFYSDHFAQRLTLQRGVQVVTASQIAALIGLERQKQLMGCGGDESCVVELAGALGADALITGSIAKFGNSYQINISILDARNGAGLSVHSQRVSGDEGALDELNRAAERMAQETFLAVRGPDAIAPPPAGTRPPVAAAPAKPWERGTVGRYWWAPVVAGAAVAAGAGGYWFVQANGYYRDLVQLTAGSNVSLSDARAIRDQGHASMLNGALWVGGGLLAGVAVGGALYLLDSPKPAAPRVALVPIAGGVGVVIGGAL